MDICFEWDDEKAHSNLKKHHVSFEIAARAFLDPLALSVQDRIEGGEYRWQTLGVVDSYLLLLVAHTVRQSDESEIIEIISARKADKKERAYYEKNH
ncbi:MAG: BrnT family toxin [Sideroxydans sp.]|nr:BrnT family toxin [Sideroxydans sp.]